jgi:4-diphosphocytidyl-2C-methyl-D-erythritol kinase
LKVILTNIPCGSKSVYEKFDKSKNKKHQINDLQQYALENKHLMSIYKKLKLKFKNVVLSGSGGSFIAFN